ncbi:MAG: hypothetical protein U1G07_21595 [Verrucomicrobiota bacterium]
MRDKGHLPTPVQVRMAGLFLPFPGPRSPYRCLLLCCPDQHNAIFAFARRGFKAGARRLLFVLSLLELDPGNSLTCLCPLLAVLAEAELVAQFWLRPGNVHSATSVINFTMDLLSN